MQQFTARLFAFQSGSAGSSLAFAPLFDPSAASFLPSPASFLPSPTSFVPSPASFVPRVASSLRAVDAFLRSPDASCRRPHSSLPSARASRARTRSYPLDSQRLIGEDRKRVTCTSTMRIGVIGSGNISTTHVRAVDGLRGAAVVAVYGRTLERARALAATVGAAPSDTLETFFASAEMDMVAIGTPSGLHGEHSAAAASRGLHVLVEKPLEITT